MGDMQHICLKKAHRRMFLRSGQKNRKFTINYMLQEYTHAYPLRLFISIWVPTASINETKIDSRSVSMKEGPLPNANKLVLVVL